MLSNKILGFLIFLGATLIAAIFYVSLGSDQNFDAEHKTPFLIAIAALIPLALFILIKTWRKPQ